MKKTLLTIASVCAAVVAVQAQNAKPAIPRDAALEAKVEKTLAKMTLDEKIGQMLRRCALYSSSTAGRMLRLKQW